MGVDDEDPFAGLTLDEDFIRGARRQEHSADERARQARAGRKVARQLLKDERRGRRRSRRKKVVRVVRIGLVVAVIAGATGLVLTRLGASGSASSAAGPLDLFEFGVVNEHPPPQPIESERPLGSPPPAPAGGGPHSFMQTQPRSDEPVTYDPCRTIPVVVNARTAPEDADKMLDEALHRVTEVTGLHFRLESTTDEVPTPERKAYQPERYGQRWAPVLVAWTDPYEIPRLHGDIAGLGGSVATTVGGGLTYVTGTVYLDGPSLGPLDVPSELIATRAVLLHELGHLVGLEHVDGVHQLMDSKGDSRTIVDYQSGDLTGLHALGSGPCRSGR